MLCDTCGIPYLQGYQGFIDRDLKNALQQLILHLHRKMPL